LVKQNSIKIIFVVNNLKRRGAEQQLYNFITSLPPYIDISVFRFSNEDDFFPEIFNDERIKIYSSKYAGTYNVLKFWSLYKCLSNQKYDVLFTLGLGTALFLGRICAALTDIRIVYSCLNTFENFNSLHGLSGEYFDILNKTVNHFISKKSCSRIYRFLPNSERLTRRIRSSLKNYPVQTLYNGLKPDEFESVSGYRPDKEIKKIYFRFKGYPTVVQAGELDENKNQLFTLKCIEDIRLHIPDVRLLIIGDGVNRQSLREKCLTGGLDQQVIFAGQLSRMDCLYLMSKANLLVLTSNSESFPNVLLEAQSLALPVVTFDVGATGEIIKHNVTGYVVSHGNVKEFRESMIGLLTDKKLAQMMGRRGKKKMFRVFNMDKKAKRFLTLMEADLHRVNTASDQ